MFLAMLSYNFSFAGAPNALVRGCSKDSEDIKFCVCPFQRDVWNLLEWYKGELSQLRLIAMYATSGDEVIAAGDWQLVVEPGSFSSGTAQE